MDETIEALKRGDHEMFHYVLELYHTKTFRFFYKRTNNVDDGKELTQQCFIRLWEYRSVLSGDYSIERQIFAIAKSLWFNYVKKENVQQRLKSYLLQTNDRDVGLNIIVSDEHFEGKDFMNVAFGQLSAVQRQILNLKFVGGFTNKEISKQLSLSIKTVEWHISKAYSHLREVVNVI